MLRSSLKGRQAGFTLVELLVVLVILVIVLTVTMQLLFAMNRSAVRQRLQVEARQTARGAADYLAYMLRPVSDADVPQPNGLGLLFHTTIAGTARQAGFDNVTNAALADPGTDILTFAVPSTTAAIPVARWPGNQAAANPWWGFDLGCDGSVNQDDKNLALFKQMIGFQEPDGPSQEIMLVDEAGNTAWYQICDFVGGGSDCAGGNPCGGVPCVKVRANPGCTGGIVPPGGYTGLTNPRLLLGLTYFSVRVRDGWLEQKQGIFNPLTDNPGTAFVRLLPNVEDLQFAYVFDNGEIWNNEPGRTLTTTGGVPTNGANAWTDAGNISAIRITVVTRSEGFVPGDFEDRFFRPQSENRPAGTDRDLIYRHQISTLTMLRNRVGGI